MRAPRGRLLNAVRRVLEVMPPWLAPDLVRHPLLRLAVRFAMRHETELRLLPDLVRPNAFAVDVGGNVGTYTVVLIGLCSSARVVCFEPLPVYNRRLRRLLPDARVVATALSSREGRATLRTPLVSGVLMHSRSTVEPDVQEALQTGAQEIEVAVTTLNAYAAAHALAPIGFVKIDVEGHELDVLRGADEVLVRQRPRLLIEAEQRHHAYPLQHVFDEVLRHGYRGFFIDTRQRTVRPLAEFDHTVHQVSANHGTRSYIGNFIFLPEEEAETIRPALQRRVIRAT